MVQRAHKRWQPSIKAGTAPRNNQFWNPWPEANQRDPHLPSGPEKPAGVGATRRTDCDTADFWAKKGRPIDA